MPRNTTIMTWLALAATGLGCASDPVESPSNENFARTWYLTKCEYRNQANTTEKVDLVADGWVVVLYVNDNGMFRYSATPAGGSEQFVDGSWSVSGSTLTLTPNGAGYSWQFTAQVRESSMTLKGGHAEYDFNNDGVPEQAIWDMAGHT